MWSFRRSRNDGNDLEALLRANRSDARDEFVEGLSSRMSRTTRRPTAWSRLAFAAAASSFIIGMFGAVGGFAYVSSGASATYSVAKQAVVKHKVSLVVHDSAASAQYPDNPAPPTQNVAGVETQHSSGVAGVASAKTLPFTGVSILTPTLIGLALIALGFALRRRERRSS
jgi:hypothetical protein